MVKRSESRADGCEKSIVEERIWSKRGMEEAGPCPFAVVDSTSLSAEIATATTGQYNERQKIQKEIKVWERMRIERAGFYPPPNWSPNPLRPATLPAKSMHHTTCIKLRRLELVMMMIIINIALYEPLASLFLSSPSSPVEMAGDYGVYCFF